MIRLRAWEPDNVILLLNKPAGVLTQKAKPEDLSLNEWLIGHLLATDAITEADLATFHPSVCNRLDRNTSGIVLCGKTLSGSQALSRYHQDRTVKKYYQTICKGKIVQESTLEGYLYKEESTNTVKVYADPSEAPAEASYIRTIYMPNAVAGDFTLLTVELVTGKTHQIRAQKSVRLLWQEVLLPLSENRSFRHAEADDAESIPTAFSCLICCLDPCPPGRHRASVVRRYQIRRQQIKQENAVGILSAISSFCMPEGSVFRKR